MGRYEDFIRLHATPRWRTQHVVIGGLIVGLLVWASQAELDQVAVAMGEVVPQGKVKVIQHLEGGIIAGIEVSEGDQVTSGQPLVSLDLATSGINREELRAGLDELLLSRARLDAEASGTTAKFPEDISGRRPDLMASEQQAFDARAAELAKSVAVVGLQVDQRKKEIIELTTKRKAAERDMALAEEELTMKASMLKDDLTSKLVVLKAKQGVTRLRGERDVIKQTLPRIRKSLAEFAARREEIVLKYRRKASEDLVKTNREIERVRERFTLAEDQQQRAVIRSPIDGVVKNMKYATIGGVVRGGEPIMEIVPSSDALEVEARLSPSDRGYVAVGQPAKVKISAYDFIRYGALDGQVVGIAADTNIDQEQGAFYRVTIRTDKAYLGNLAGVYLIRPGMQATVDIGIGEQTVLDYLLRPVLKVKHEAFREP